MLALQDLLSIFIELKLLQRQQQQVSVGLLLSFKKMVLVSRSRHLH